ncbi:unnamed protein product [Rotaria sordida]|uniref:Uncharacterized protein n=1 Tax=Rotaria sordida TaxID=392033 RepID=A0A814B6Q3_9BILA|nr:unnamed protein product [Rotaria sordida]CAF1550131.1 unnamed protein product [Rotaria sordida]
MASGIIIAGDVVASLTTSAAIVGLGLTAADKIGSAYGRISAVEQSNYYYHHHYQQTGHHRHYCVPVGFNHDGHTYAYHG